MTRAAVTGCTADFTVGAMALLTTLRRHHPEVARICFTLPEHVDAVRLQLNDLATVTAIPRVLSHAPDDAKLRVSWSRVFIPTVAADVVAWFDSDVIVCEPAPEWWDVPANHVNAVADRAYRIRHMVPLGMEAWYFARFNLQPGDRGFNAGMFALRPQDHPDLAERFEAVLAEQDAAMQPFAMDQGILNGLFQPRVNWLPPEFNAHCLSECGVPRGVKAIHYTGSPKPWQAGYDRAAQGYVEWLRATDGDGVARAQVMSLLAKPRRWLHRGVRKAKAIMGVKDEMGVGKKPS